MDEATDQIRAADSDDNTEQLRAEIEDTRADMTQTINEIKRGSVPNIWWARLRKLSAKPR